VQTGESSGQRQEFKKTQLVKKRSHSKLQIGDPVVTVNNEHGVVQVWIEKIRMWGIITNRGKRVAYKEEHLSKQTLDSIHMESTVP